MPNDEARTPIILITDLEALLAKATPGPLKAMQVTTQQYGGPEHGWGILAVEPMRGRIDSAISGMKESDAQLIAATHNALPAILTALRLGEKIAPMLQCYCAFLAVDYEDLPCDVCKFRDALTALGEGPRG